MAGLGAQLADPRRRNLALLTALTILFVVLAVIAVSERSQEMAPKFAPRLVFPELKDHFNELAAVRIESKTGKFTIRFDSHKGWLIAEKGGYPADESQVRATAVGIAELELVEPKTARADWLRYVDLGSPEKGGGATKVTLLDASSQPLAAVLLGKTEPTADASGRGGIYIRSPADTQAWLARGYLAARPAIGDWLDKRVLSLTRERIKETAVLPLAGPSYTVLRETPEDADFKLSEIPKGRELTYDAAPDAVGASLVGFAFEDVQSAATLDFTHATRVNTTTFDGLTVAVKVIEQNGGYWASLLAAGTGPAAQAEAGVINARTGGWAYKIPEYKAKMFLTSLESLLKPAASPAKAPVQAGKKPAP